MLEGISGRPWCGSFSWDKLVSTWPAQERECGAESQVSQGTVPMSLIPPLKVTNPS